MFTVLRRARHLVGGGILLSLLTFSSLVVGACHPPASIQTPAGKAAFRADQVVIRLGEFQNAVIAANRQGTLADSISIRLVQFCVDTTRVLKTTPTGWEATVTTAWATMKRDIPQLNTTAWLPYVASLDTLLAVLQ